MTSVCTGRSAKKCSLYCCVFSVGAALGYKKQNSYIFTSNHKRMCFNIHVCTCFRVLKHIFYLPVRLIKLCTNFTQFRSSPFFPL
jgi:hypothetical protein